MSNVYTRIGYVKGDPGAQGERGLQGDPGEAATIEVGSVTTVPYGQTANVTNSGTEQAAVFDFTIPQGRPGQQTTEMDNLLLNSITTSAASFPIPAVGETGKVLWGKVTKWFSDMAALVATKFNAANVVNNLTTTSSGYALDARQGKALNDALGTEESEALNTSAANVKIRRVGKIYGMYCATATNIPNTWTSIGYLQTVIPQGAEYYGQFISNTGVLIKVRIRTSGEVLMFALTPVTSRIYVESGTMLVAA